MRAHMKRDKIQEALELLNEAAQGKKEEVLELFGNKYEHLKDFFQTTAHNGEVIAGQAKKKIIKNLYQEEKKIKSAAAHWNKKIHEEPWPVVSGVAIGALVLGLFLGHRK